MFIHMKRFNLIILTILLASGTIFAGGLVHNTNQSAAWSRMLSRAATLDIDAVYFNPAGLVKMQDGFHISISSQSIWQDKPITSSFPFLNHDKYDGKVTAPVFPSVYIAYKTGKFAFSFGFLPLGGGGSAEYNDGLPFMETPIAALVPTFGGMGVTGYSLDMQFKGTSIYWGMQAGVSYEINKNISVFAGARYILAKNKYTGYMRNINLETTGGDISAELFLTNLANSAAGAGSSVQPIIDGGGSQLTWDQAIAAGILTEEQSTSLQQGLVSMGVPQEQVAAMNIEQAQGAYFGTAQKLERNASLMVDQEGDITQKGSGITPIIGANLNFLNEKLNIGLKYEFETKLELENEVPDGKGFQTGIDETTGQPIYMFVDGDKINADLPAMLSIGVDYNIIDPLKISFSYHNYFDKDVEWAEENGVKEIDNNYWELAVGLEYSINDKFLVSTGYLHAHTGVNQNYQSNLAYSLSSNTFAVGGAYRINDMLKLNIGAYIANYEKETYNESYIMNGADIPYTETFEKQTIAVAIGIDIAIGNKN